MPRSLRWVIVFLSIPWLLSAAPPGATTVVASAPGYPGSTAEAQAAMDSFASALARAAHWPDGSASAVYYPKEADGVARLGKPDAGVALVTLPFYLAHREDLGLKARLAVEMKSVGLSERWALVAKKGRVKSPADLANMTVSSIAGYAPNFVRGVLGAWGRIPDTAKVEVNTQVLSALRKASTTGDMAVLLDGEQSASLGSLPFAKDLEVVARSEPVPAGLVATVRNNTPEKRWPEIQKALLAMSSDPKGIEALASIRMVRFAPLDEAKLAAATAACGSGVKP